MTRRKKYLLALVILLMLPLQALALSPAAEEFMRITRELDDCAHCGAAVLPLSDRRT